MHGALVRVNFPAYDPEDASFNQTRRIVFSLDKPVSDSLEFGVKDSTSGLPQVSGVSTSNSGGVAEGACKGLYAKELEVISTPNFDSSFTVGFLILGLRR